MILVVIFLGVALYVWTYQNEIISSRTPHEKWVTGIPFDEDDPRDWSSYKGQEKLKDFIRIRIHVLENHKGIKLLLIAPKGAGKTTLFRLIAKDLIDKRGGRYIEITPAMLKTKKQLDELMSSLQDKDVLCIDEIHMLSRKLSDTLLPAIEDNIYPFDNGMRQLPQGISWIGATTDVGLLPEALRDRFYMLSLSDLGKEEMFAIVKSLSFPITEEACHELISRASGSPRELKKLFTTCKEVCMFLGKEKIDKVVVDKALNLLELDENGLYKRDRSALEVLAKNPKYYAPRADGRRPKRYAQSERALRALIGQDEALYRDEVEPKLLKAGFLTISSAGRELTPKAIETYFPDLE